MQISVVIPLYNKKEQVCRALNSVFKQSFQPLEIIVVNDGSTDGSDNLVEELNHPLVNLVHQVNAGVSAARNKGIELAKGEWIAFLDADDEWKPQFLETLKDLKNEFPKANILATTYELQDHRETTNHIVLNKIPFKDNQGILFNYFEVAACSHPPICSSSVIIRKLALQNINGFPKELKSGEDLLTWARLAIYNDIAYSLISMSIFHQDAAHTYDDRPNRIPDEKDIIGAELITLYKKNKKEFGLKYYVSHWFKMRASIYLRLGQNKKALREIYKSIYYHPLNIKIYIYIIVLLLPLEFRAKIFKKFGTK